MHKERIVAKELGGNERILFDKEDLDKVEELAAYLTSEQIADYFGICRKAFYDIRQRQPDVATRYQKGKASKILQFAKHLEQKALGKTDKGDTGCLVFYLKTQGRWAEAREEVIERTIETEEQRAERLRRTELFLIWEKEYEQKKLEENI